MHKIPSEQATFKFMLDGAMPGGLPVAQIVQWGNGLWVKCCPLCGLLHEVRGGLPRNAIFEPQCIVKQLNPRLYLEWTARFPDAGHYAHIRLLNENEFKVVQPAKPSKRVKARAA